MAVPTTERGRERGKNPLGGILAPRPLCGDAPELAQWGNNLKDAAGSTFRHHIRVPDTACGHSDGRALGHVRE